MNVLKITIFSILSSLATSTSSNSANSSKKKFFNFLNKDKKKSTEEPSPNQDVSKDSSTDDSFPYVPVYLM